MLRRKTPIRPKLKNNPKIRNSVWRLETDFPSPKIESKIIVFKPKSKINIKIRKIENLEKITHLFFSSKRKMINKAFSKIFKNHKEVAESLNINLSKRPGELSFEEFYKITEKYEKVNKI